nr:hypothetical protein [Candidatus Paceibacterota bacterium]
QTIQSTSSNALVLQSSYSSTAGLTFGSTSTPNVLGIDTINNRVTLGTGGADPSLLVLDNKNTPGDPTGVAGAQYYNSNTDEFRCFATSWVTCGGQAASSTGDVQFRNVDGSFAATSNFNWSQVNNRLMVQANPAQTGSVLSVASSTGDAVFGVDGNGVMTLSSTTDPSAPNSGELNLYVKEVAGRLLPKWKGPSGVDTAFQPALFGNQITLFNPSTGTVGTGAGTGIGPAWTSNGTVTHPTPSTAAPAVSNQMKRTRYANIVTTQNQQLGPRFNAASERLYWRGDAPGLGGFFFFTRFVVELYPAPTVRIFAGLAGTANTGPVISDTVTVQSAGLWHDTTDNSSTFNFLTRSASATTKTPIALSNPIAAGNSYDFYMYAKPNDTVIYYRLVDIVNDVVYEGSTSSTLPADTTFMQPQVQMSNGTANTTVTTVAIGVNRIYVESDR